MKQQSILLLLLLLLLLRLYPAVYNTWYTSDPYHCCRAAPHRIPGSNLSH